MQIKESFETKITQWKEYGRRLINRNVPEGDIDGHCAEEQAHAAWDPLGPSERTAGGRIHDGHPDVFVPEASRCSALENIPDRRKRESLETQIQLDDGWVGFGKLFTLWPKARNLIVLRSVERFLGHAVSTLSTQPAVT